MFDRVRTGWYSVHVTSHPDKIYDALNASIAVLRDIAVNPINRRELSRCVLAGVLRGRSVFETVSGSFADLDVATRQAVARVGGPFEA